jgi:hypothetical protein
MHPTLRGMEADANRSKVLGNTALITTATLNKLAAIAQRLKKTFASLLETSAGEPPTTTRMLPRVRGISK